MSGQDTIAAFIVFIEHICNDDVELGHYILSAVHWVSSYKKDQCAFQPGRSAHRAALFRPDWCDGYIQLKRSCVDTNLLDTDSYSHGAEPNGSRDLHCPTQGSSELEGCWM